MDNEVFVIAEAGVNHNGDLATALQLVDVAAQSGADAIKFQTFRVDALVTSTLERTTYQTRNIGESGAQAEMLRSLVLSDNDYAVLKERANLVGVEFMSTAFDEDSLDFVVDKLRVRRIKIPSGELTNIPFLVRCAQKGLPLLVSTGMATMPEIRLAMDAIQYGHNYETVPSSLDAIQGGSTGLDARRSLSESVTLLQCTSDYPTAPQDVNLRAMLTMQSEFGVEVGFSDHTEGIEMSIAASALGASVIEKHFTLDRSMAGPDHAASLEPAELAEMIRCIRSVRIGLGSARKQPTAQERKMAPLVRKVLVAARQISQGQILGPDDITAKRAGQGLTPQHYWQLIGTRAIRNYQRDDIFEESAL